MTARAISVLSVVALLGTAGVAFYNAERAQVNSERIARLEDTGLSRAAAWRLCERQSRVKAELRVEHPERVRFMERHLPIVDCSPNLRGQHAKALPPERQREYVDGYAAGRLPALPEVNERGRNP